LFEWIIRTWKYNMAIGGVFTVVACTMAVVGRIDESAVVMIPAMLAWCIGFAGKPKNNGE
jgi:hypothetical protein